MSPKIFIAIVVVLVLGIGGFFVYGKYFSPEARAERHRVALLTADTSGGATPEETMNLFIAALEAGDVQKASEYFAYDENLERNHWKEALQSIQDGGFLDDMAKDMKEKRKADIHSRAETGEFRFFLEQDGATVAVVILTLNTYSGVWKIESF